MKFYVGSEPDTPKPFDIVLMHDSWDDWFAYSTLYSVTYFDEDLNAEYLGAVKIGAHDIVIKKNGGDGVPKLPKYFDKLPSNFFSLGQDIDYYTNINEISDEFRHNFMTYMNDVSFNKELFDEIINLDVTQVSLLRSVPIKTVNNDYRNLSKGQSALSKYHFRYSSALSSEKDGTRFDLEFDVVPNAFPPTNIHVIIGRNGVGKTHLLSNMVKTLTKEKATLTRYGKFYNDYSENIFANVVAVSFSAFDNLDISKERKRNNGNIHYKYIGLRKEGRSNSIVTKSMTSLTNEFWERFDHCMSTGKKDRWLNIISMLNSDPIFENVNVSELAKFHGDIECEEKCKKLFKRLSSGHSIVLLTITSLVSTVEQSTLALLDEPEAHLHPPLLSAFIRALSRLLYIKNGVAIIATHSPVVLQEVPKSCVWRLDRYNKQVKAERLEIETFGANIGSLTREVFGYEVTNSGFHNLINKISQEVDTFDEAVDKFGNALGDEALGILKGMIYFEGDR